MSQKEQNTRLLDMLREEIPDYHPLIAMLRIAKDPAVDPQLRFNCHKEIAQYVEPKMKTVEHSGTVKHDFGVLRVVSSVEKLEDSSSPKLTSSDPNQTHGAIIDVTPKETA